ncbi:uncharacterized protein LOC106090843 isoform X2 [Stomoxys calcitrans]|nr:uncharacterized protein LOC106090843 isoform X2 [Stomoxys calcitrans]
MALKRLYYVENQMARNSEYASACVLIAAHWSAKYKREGIRIVFDAAAEVQNVSLSKCLLRGPDFNNTLISTIFKFREAPVAVCGDIKEMFHQIKIAKEDQDCQRFLWRNGDQNKKVEVYVMQRMIFGVTCSPTIAQFIENLNAQRFLEEVPRAVHGIIDRHYVDDYVECFDTEDEAVSVVKDVIKIHSASGFELRNIISNLERVVRSCGQSASGGNSCEFLNKDNIEIILGIYWFPSPDVFCFRINFHKVEKSILEFTKVPTKPEMLALNMSIYDPFGFLCKFMITSKILMQRIWKAGIGWDEELPIEIHRDWKL